MKGAPWQLYDEVRSVFGRRYPAFVYGGALREGEEVPVFVFHQNEPADLEEKLRYLMENGYAAIAPDDYLAWSRGEASVPPRAVLLTIDDGRASVRRHWPSLLERYGLRATVFLIPGYMRPRGDRGATTGGGEGARQRAGSGLLSWEDVAEMHATGRFDFQSHTLYHHPVFRDDRPVDIYEPGRVDALWDLPVPAGYERHVADGTIASHAGFPIYRSDSIFRSMCRFLDEEEVRLEAEERFQSLGGREWLAASSSRHGGGMRWLRRELLATGRAGRLQPAEETRREIRQNLADSKALIETRLGARVRHLCYPYSLVCPEVARIAREVGYEAQYLGVDPGRRTNRRGDDPHRTVRLKHDYLMTLPGADRRTLRAILARKLRRRAGGQRGV